MPDTRAGCPSWSLAQAHWTRPATASLSSLAGAWHNALEVVVPRLGSEADWFSPNAGGAHRSPGLLDKAHTAGRTDRHIWSGIRPHRLPVMCGSRLEQAEPGWRASHPAVAPDFTAARPLASKSWWWDRIPLLGRAARCPAWPLERLFCNLDGRGSYALCQEWRCQRCLSGGRGGTAGPGLRTGVGVEHRSDVGGPFDGPIPSEAGFVLPPDLV